jgi:hypothetical protein
VIEFPRRLGSNSKKIPEKSVAKTVEKYWGSKEAVEKEKTVQIQRSLWNPLIKNSEKPKVQSTIHTDYRKYSEKTKTDVTKLYQKPKLISSSDEYEEEEEDNADDSYDNNQKTSVTPSIKKLPFFENKKKAQVSESEEDEEELTPEEENELFIC